MCTSRIPPGKKGEDGTGRWDELEPGMADWEEVMKALLEHKLQWVLFKRKPFWCGSPGATGFIGEKLSISSAESSNAAKTHRDKAGRGSSISE